MQTIRATHLHLREGSTGAECISALLKVVLSLTWLSGNANSSSSIFAVLNTVPGGVWMLLTVGVAHLVAWSQPDQMPWLAIRKACSCVGLAVWIALIYDLAERQATATVILVAPMAVLMVVGILRRRYSLL